METHHQYFAGFIREFPRLKTHFKEILAQHYSFDIFTDEIAKRRLLAPDLLPFE